MRTPTRLALIALAGLCSNMALAQSIQLKPSVSVRVERDDNIFRAPSTTTPGGVPVVADTITTASVGARLTLAESLQSLEVQGDYGRLNYARNDNLNQNRYRVGARTKLALASLLRFEAEADRERRQEDFSFRDDTENGLITLNRARAALRLRVTPRWTGLIGGDHFSTRASRVPSRDFDLTENSASAGVEYQLTGFSVAGLGVRATRGEFPNRVVTPGDGREKTYDQQSIALTGGYTPSGLSELTGQLAYTRRTHDDPLVDDFAGVTGRFGYERRFSGVSQAKVEAYRDLFYVEDVNANFVENLGARGEFEYRWSAKLGWLLSAEYYRSSFEGSPDAASLGEQREDRVSDLRAAMNYRAFYRFTARPFVRQERRDSNLVTQRYEALIYGIDLLYDFGPADTR